MPYSQRRSPPGSHEGSSREWTRETRATLANGRVVGPDRFGDALDPLLDRPLAPRYPAHGGTQVLPGTAARSHEARPLTPDTWAPRSLATDVVGRDGRCAALAA